MREPLMPAKVATQWMEEFGQMPHNELQRARGVGLHCAQDFGVDVADFERGAGQRLFPLGKDFGLVPDMLQDAKNVGLTPLQLAPLFGSAEDYLKMWEKANR